MMALSRRALLEALALLGTSAACARAMAGEGSAPALSVDELEIPGETRLARHCLLLTPTARKPERLLVLCHGLGETVQVKLGLYAWAKPYGLQRAYERLLGAPLARGKSEAGYLTDDHLSRINDALSRQPFGGLAIACPFTPNVYNEKSTALALDRYASWLAGALVPEVTRRLSLPSANACVGIDGVSLGGFVALEVFLRKPESFAAFGCMQGAFGVSLAELYARRIADVFARVGRRSVHVSTSNFDPFRPAAERLHKRLVEAGADVDFVRTPGPHSQSWLREVGSLDVLCFYDRVLHATAGAAKPGTN